MRHPWRKTGRCSYQRNLKGYTVKDLYERVSRSYLRTYGVVAKYCRCTDMRSWKDEKLQKAITQALNDMGVEWVITAQAVDK